MNDSPTPQSITSDSDSDSNVLYLSIYLLPFQRFFGWLGIISSLIAFGNLHVSFFLHQLPTPKHPRS